MSDDSLSSLMNSVQWMIDHNEPIPLDVVKQLGEMGIFINNTKYTSDTINTIKADIQAIKDELATPPIEIPITQVNFAPILDKLDNLVSTLSGIVSLPAPVVTVNIPKQEFPVVNVNVPEQKSPVIKVEPQINILPDDRKRRARVLHDKNGFVTGIEEY